MFPDPRSGNLLLYRSHPGATAAPSRILRVEPPIVVSAAPRRFDLMAVGW